MSIQLPSQPWQEGDTFTNDATGVEYTFDGVKWLASGGEELDMSHFEDRLDDIEAVLPSNAPQPVNIGDQTLKVTGSRPVGAGGEDGVMLVWKSQTGGPGNPFNEAKFICPDKDAIDLNASEIWLKQGNTIQKWDTAGGGWWTNNNVFHVSATATEGDALIDGQPVELYYSDPGVLFYLEVISRDESKADDQLLQDQIDSHDHDEYATLIELEELQVEVDALVTTREAGQWMVRPDGNAPRAGEVMFATYAMGARNQIVINETDANGTVHKFAGLEVGDYVEVVQETGDKVGVYGLHVITADEGGEGVRSLLTDPYQSNGNLSPDNTVFIKIFHANSDLDLADLDQRYALKAHTHDTAPTLGRRFKYTTSSSPGDGFFFVNSNDAVFSFTDQNGGVRKMTNSPDFSWNDTYKMTVWGMDGELCWAADMRVGTNYASQNLKLYIGTVKYDRGLVVGDEYDVVVGGYW